MDLTPSQTAPLCPCPVLLSARLCSASSAGGEGRDLSAFETVPGEEEGIARLWLARQDREIAASLASAVNRAIAELSNA
jgi:hypothetical protein